MKCQLRGLMVSSSSPASRTGCAPYAEYCSLHRSILDRELQAIGMALADLYVVRGSKVDLIPYQRL